MKNAKILIYTDASTEGWGAIGRVKRQGAIGSNKKEEHINVLELKAILFGLQSLVYEQEVRVGVFTDKTRALAYVGNMGRVRSP